MNQQTRVCKRLTVGPLRLGPLTLGKLLLALATVAFVISLMFSGSKASSQGYADGSGVSRSVPGGLTLDYEGFTEPKRDVLVAATEIGRLSDVNVVVGQRVDADEVVAKLEDVLQHEAVSTARFRVQMRGELEAAKAEVDLMVTRVEQLKLLDERRMAAPDELKRATADWEIAKAKHLSASEQVMLRKQELERFLMQLDRRKIRAPMSGVVAEVFHAPGEYITPADPAVIRLLDTDQLYGVFNIPIEEMKGVEVGIPVTVSLMSYEKLVEGKIAEISPVIDGESGTVKVKVLLDNRQGKLLSGDRCQMRVRSQRSARSSMPQRSRIQLSLPRNTPDASKGGTVVR